MSDKLREADALIREMTAQGFVLHLLVRAPGHASQARFLPGGEKVTFDGWTEVAEAVARAARLANQKEK